MSVVREIRDLYRDERDDPAASRPRVLYECATAVVRHRLAVWVLRVARRVARWLDVDAR